MKKSLLFVFFFSLCAYGFSQSAIGLRLGGTAGITYRGGALGNFSNFEIIAAVPYNDFLYGTFLVEDMQPLSGDLQWFYGFGGHAIIGSDYFGAGVDGILGLNINIPDTRLNLSIDWKPGFNLIGGTGFWSRDGALSIRYIL